MNSQNTLEKMKQLKNKSKEDFINNRKELITQIFSEINDLTNQEIELMENKTSGLNFENVISINCLNGLIKCEINWNQDSILNFNNKINDNVNLKFNINKKTKAYLVNPDYVNENENIKSLNNVIQRINDIEIINNKKEELKEKEIVNNKEKINENNLNQNIKKEINNSKTINENLIKCNNDEINKNQNKNIKEEINKNEINDIIKKENTHINKEEINENKNKKKNVEIDKEIAKNEENIVEKNQKEKSKKLTNKKRKRKNNLNNKNDKPIKKRKKENNIKKNSNNDFFKNLSEKEKTVSQILKNNKNSFSKIKNEKDNIFLSEIINSILSFNLKTFFQKIKPEKKINLVLNLFNTLVYEDIYDEKSKIKENQFTFSFEDKQFIISLRKNIKYFFKELGKFCNFYIYSNINENVGNTIINKLKEKFSISFYCYYDLENLEKNLKYLKLNKNNTLIIDDMVNVWKSDNKITLPSKKFIKENKKEEKILITLNYTDKNQMKNLKQYFENSLVYFIEDENCENEGQLFYLVKAIQIIYIMINNLNLKSSYAFSLLRSFIFYGYTFNLKFCSEELENCLENMIECLGGNILNENKASFALVGENNLKNQYRKIIELKKKNNHIFIVKEQYVIDSYYFIMKMNENLYLIDLD